MNTLFKFMIIMVFFISLTFSKENKVFSLICEYNNTRHALTISENEKKIEFSVGVGLSNTKTLFIKDTNNPSELNDWVKIENKQGYKIVYPLKCNKR